MEKHRTKETRAVRPMRSLVPSRIWEPDFGRIVEEFWRRPFPSLFGPERWWPISTIHEPMPALDIYEEKGELVVKAELPGMSKEEIEVSLSDNALTISGEKKKAEEVKEKDYYRLERSHGVFSRVVELPADVEGTKVRASFKDGVLEIRLPKSEEAKRKEHKVKVE